MYGDSKFVSDSMLMVKDFFSWRIFKTSVNNEYLVSLSQSLLIGILLVALPVLFVYPGGGGGG